MRLIKRTLRPLYRQFFERPLWWFLARVKAFFLAEIGVQIQQTGQQVAAIEERLRTIEANNAAQWMALEQLLLALFRQPEVLVDAGDLRNSPPAGELNFHAAGSNERINIR